MYKELAELKVTTSSDYKGKVVKALEDAGFIVVVTSDNYYEAHYIVAESEG